jgi:hypothetical protein
MLWDDYNIRESKNQRKTCSNIQKGAVALTIEKS